MARAALQAHLPVPWTVWGEKSVSRLQLQVPDSLLPISGMPQVDKCCQRGSEDPGWHPSCVSCQIGSQQQGLKGLSCPDLDLGSLEVCLVGVRKGLSGRRLSHSPWAMLEGLFLRLWHSRWLYHHLLPPPAPGLPGILCRMGQTVVTSSRCLGFVLTSS